ncbi:MAG: hypothetical protein JEY91_12560, partial [Spirochaetaceae bacterium]|nr:hypothetical protein [Spirochaetaceae bacterium]
MKISQRVLILIVINIFSLLCMAGVIYLLGENEEEYYKLSSTILDFKLLIFKKQYTEKMMLQNDRDYHLTEQLNFEVKAKFNEINQSLLKDSEPQFLEIGALLNKREKLIESTRNSYLFRKTKIFSIQKRSNDYLLKYRELEDLSKPELLSPERLVNDDIIQLHYINREIISKINQLKLMAALSVPVPEILKEMMRSLQIHLEFMTEAGNRSSYNDYVLWYNDSVEMYRFFLETSESILQYNNEIESGTTQLDLIDDQILLIVENIRNEILYIMQLRNDQELFAIISGLLLITLISIIATAAFGQSIIKPIEQLKSYVLSINLSHISLDRNRFLKEKIDARKNLEISQLAESYSNLENALFNRMNELKERSDKLSLELLERKKTERKLKKTERYLNNIIQSLNSIVITADNKLNLIHSNDHAAKIAVKKDKNLFLQFPFLQVYRDKIDSVLLQNHPYIENSIEIESLKDRYFNITISPLAGEKTDGIVIRLDDVTNLKSIENQLIETQKWETLGVLTSGFAHDFNNVLTGIVTSSSILLHKSEKDYPDLDKAFVNCLEIIDKSGKRAAAMVQQLLSLSRSNELNFESIDLNQSISDIESICKNSFDKSVDIEVELLGESIPVIADYAQIEQSVLNLCINSYHAMTDMRSKDEEPGGVLRITMKKVCLDKYNKPDARECIPGDYIALS